MPGFDHSKTLNCSEGLRDFLEEAKTELLFSTATGNVHSSFSHSSQHPLANPGLTPTPNPSLFHWYVVIFVWLLSGWAACCTWARPSWWWWWWCVCEEGGKGFRRVLGNTDIPFMDTRQPHALNKPNRLPGVRLTLLYLKKKRKKAKQAVLAG